MRETCLVCCTLNADRSNGVAYFYLSALALNWFRLIYYLWPGQLCCDFSVGHSKNAEGSDISNVTKYWFRLEKPQSKPKKERFRIMRGVMKSSRIQLLGLQNDYTTFNNNKGKTTRARLLFKYIRGISHFSKNWKCLEKTFLEASIAFWPYKLISQKKSTFWFYQTKF